MTTEQKIRAKVGLLLGNVCQAHDGVLQCAEAGRFATPTAPRPASACDSPWGTRTTSVRLSFT